MQIAIAGGHGTIAQHLTRRLVESGHTVHSIIRSEDQTDEIEGLGARPVVVDLESVTPEELTAAIGTADCVVFAAGAGSGSGAARKESVDHQGAVKLLAAGEALGSRHYVMLSSMGADAEHEGDEVFDAYLRAKGKADDAVRQSSLGHTIVRPTSLTDDDPIGTVTLAEKAEGDSISRADVAHVLAALIDAAAPTGRTLELTAGDQPVAEAVASAQS